MFSSIVVGTDGSEGASKAVLAAAELAATQFALRPDGPEAFLPGEGGLDPGGEEGLHRLRGAGGVPGVCVAAR